MHAHRAYQKQRHVGTTRIDHILILYDEALDRLDRAEKGLQAGNASTANTAASQVQMIVTGLAAGMTASDPLSIDLLRLYEFVTDRLSRPSVENLRDSAKVLRTLREAFESIRDEARRMEREGLLPPMDRTHDIQMTA